MWPNPQVPADYVTLTEEILNGKLHFLCSVNPIAVEYSETNVKSLKLIKFWKLRETSLDKLCTDICPAVSQKG